MSSSEISERIKKLVDDYFAEVREGVPDVGRPGGRFFHPGQSTPDLLAYGIDRIDPFHLNKEFPLSLSWPWSV